MPGPYKNLFVADGLDKPFNDITTFGLLAMLAYTPQPPELTEAMREWLELDTLQFFNTGSAIIPNVLIGKGSNAVVVCVEGTAHPEQWASYFLVSEQVPATAIDPLCLVHSGFYGLFLATLSAVVRETAGLGDGTRIAFTGQSMGGAVARLLAVYFKLKTNFDVRNCVIFDAPKTGTSRMISHELTIPVLSERRVGDRVPAMPPDTSLAGLFTGLTSVTSYITAYGTLPKELVFDRDDNYLWRGRWWNESATFVLANAVLARNGFIHQGNPSREEEAHNIDNALRAVMKWRESNDPLTADQSFQNQMRYAIKQAWNNHPAQAIAEVVIARQVLISAGLLPPPPPPPAPLPPRINVEITTVSHLRFSALTPRTSVSPGVLVGGSSAGSAVSFANNPRLWWLFRGNDRRMLDKLREVLYAMQNYDNKLASAQGDKGVPSPHYLIDPADEALVDAVVTLQQRIAVLLDISQVKL